MKWRLLTPEECAEHVVPPISVGFVTEDGRLCWDAIYSAKAGKDNEMVVILPTYTEASYEDLTGILLLLRREYLKANGTET